MPRFLIPGQTEILVGKGLPRNLLPANETRSRVAVLTQPSVAERAQTVAETISKRGVDHVVVVELADGEAAKSLQAVERIYETLAEMKLGRNDTIVTVGGGAASDAGGFVAGTWLRGVEVVHLPTTLLAAIDAAIGGKTAVNLAGKNLVGVFWQPTRVVIDLGFLGDIPQALKRNGAAEAIKAGFLAAPEIIETYRRRGIDAPLDRIVPAAVRVKVEIVTEDLTERGRRALLNLGHTIGHTVEYGGGISHGEAVSVGLVAEAAIAERRLGFTGYDLMREVLEKVGLPTRAPAVDRADVMSLIELDKKHDVTGVRMVLLSAEGWPEVHTVTSEDLEYGLGIIGL